MNRLWSAVLLAAIVAVGAVVADTAMAAEPGTVVLVVDASGTMVKRDVTPNRMAVAKSAARQVVSGSGVAAMGLLTYGTSTDNSDVDKPEGCQDVTTVVPVDALTAAQRTAILAGIDS